MIKRSVLLESVRETINRSLPKIPVIADEVIEGFPTPAFFVRLLILKNTVNMSMKHVNLQVILTYYPHSRKNKELEFANIMDQLDKAFGIDLVVGERALHIENIRHDRVGEKSDIMQSEIKINYYEATGYTPDGDADKVRDIRLRVKEEEMGEINYGFEDAEH